MSTQSHIDKVNLKPMIMEYPAHVGAPKIEPLDLTSFKTHGLNKVDRVIKKRYDELVKEVEILKNSMIINQEIYESNYRFEPKIGEIYHLYENPDGSKTLSLINPTEWNKKHIYSVILNSDMTWTKIG
jgi:Protein of unknown function (DUF2452)